MERKVRDSCGRYVSKGDPAGAKAPRRLPDRPRKASAWRGNQRSQYKILKTCGQLGFHLRFHGDLIGTEGTRLLREYVSKGDPAGAKRRGGSPDRLRKASAWRGNQRSQ
ncbi:hypothetical protein ACIP97_18950 [Peribacillus frigoritolerans]|uniref:hypothetical protein n=1 Tax=Peribacillus frigoritolerans TaxID=450367 RepID=UPI00380F3624